MSDPSQDRSNEESNKALVRRLVDGFNRNDSSVIDELVAEDCVLHYGPAEPARTTWKASISMLHEAIPDIHTTIEELVAEGDIVVARETTTGTQAGELLGFPTKGNSATVPTLMMLRIVDGQIVERWAIADNLSMLMQFGHFPPS